MGSLDEDGGPQSHQLWGPAKGGLHLVVGWATDASTGAEVVVYAPLGGGQWVSTLGSWYVTVERHGVREPRFEWVSS